MRHFCGILWFCTVLKVDLLVTILFCYALLVENLIEEGTFLDMLLTSKELVRFFFILLSSLELDIIWLFNYHRVAMSKFKFL